MDGGGNELVLFKRPATRFHHFGAIIELRSQDFLTSVASLVDILKARSRLSVGEWSAAKITIKLRQLLPSCSA